MRGGGLAPLDPANERVRGRASTAVWSAWRQSQARATLPFHRSARGIIECAAPNRKGVGATQPDSRSKLSASALCPPTSAKISSSRSSRPEIGSATSGTPGSTTDHTLAARSAVITPSAMAAAMPRKTRNRSSMIAEPRCSADTPPLMAEKALLHPSLAMAALTAATATARACLVERGRPQPTPVSLSRPAADGTSR